MSDKETVTLKLPSGEDVDFVVPSGMSDDQIKSFVRGKRPELFGSQPKSLTGSAALDRVAAAGASAMAKPQPQTPGFVDQAMQGVDTSMFGGAIKGATGISGLKIISNLLAMAGRKGQEQVGQMEDLGNRGIISPEAVGAATLPGHMMESMGRIGSQAATPANVALTAASMVNRPARLGVSGYMALQGGKGIYEGLQGPMAPDKLEQLLLGASGVSASGALAGMKSPGPVSTSDAASAVRDAVNPKATIADKFQANVEGNLPQAVQIARDKGIDLGGRAGAAQAFQELHGVLKGQMQELLKPVADKTVNTGQIQGYEGSTVGENTATVQQLFDRLGVVNAELKPKFAKGGGAASAAVKSSAALNAEAQGLRRVLYDEIGRANNVDPAQVADLHGRVGQTGDVADTIMQRMAKTRERTNTTAQNEQLPHTAMEYLFRKMNQVRDATMGNPADRAIGKVLPNVEGRPVPALAGFPEQPMPGSMKSAGPGQVGIFSERSGQLMGNYKVNGNIAGQFRMTPMADGMEMSDIKLNPQYRGGVHGEEMYRQAAQEAKQRGARYLYSDDQVSPGAQSVWNRFVSQGKAVWDQATGRFKMDLNKI